MNSKSIRAAGVLAYLLVLAASVCPTVATAQDQACGEFLRLLSPRDLEISFERDPVVGNRVRWTPLPPDSLSCYDLLLPQPPNDIPIGVSVLGSFLGISDRDIVFTVADGGVVGDQNKSTVKLVWRSRNEVTGEANGEINLGNTGGIYEIEASGAGVAGQINSGFPVDLAVTNVRDIVAWTDGSGASRIYAVVPGIPILRSDDEGAIWTATVSDPLADPFASGALLSTVTGLQMAVAPSNPDILLIGGGTGIFRSEDGGANFVNVGASISQTGNQEVTFLAYDEISGRLFTALKGLGLFESTDDGLNWSAISTLLVPPASQPDPAANRVAVPTVNSLVTDPVDTNRMLVALSTWGVYATSDGGLSWERAESGMVIPPPQQDVPGRRVDVQSLLIMENAPNIVYAATTSYGLMRSDDGGFTWSDSTTIVPLTEGGTPLNMGNLLQSPLDSDKLWASTGASGILHSTDGGTTWESWNDTASSPPRTLDMSVIIHHPTIPGALLAGTEGSGVYVSDAAVYLSNTIDTKKTDDNLDNLDLGLTIQFSGTDTDTLFTGQSFSIRAQTIQGYAVWRAQTIDIVTTEPRWELIGLWDLTNPEFCLESACDAPNPQPRQGCFADKRARCFNVEEDGRISFFDRDIFNGFTYTYAISVFDYGFTGNTAPRALALDMEFSPRSEVESADQATPHLRDGNYNDKSFTVNLDPSADLENVWVVPNPLRRSAGWDGDNQSSIRFVNVTADARAEIFTLAGDLVAELTSAEGSDGLLKGNIVWDTKNADGEDVASGVYIYRITNGAGEEILGKVTIIR